MSARSEDSESVDAFLERIASLKGKRDREDEERTRKLEEEILQGRRERQARRAERARSISPLKSSPSVKSQSASDTPFTKSTSIDPPTNFLPSPPTQSSLDSSPMALSKASDTLGPTLNDQPPKASTPSPTKRSDSLRPSTTNAASLSRSGTLSWQQRPSSKDASITRQKPSILSSEPSSLKIPQSSKVGGLEEKELSRSEIAQSLNNKDPAWFRQTADRGTGSAAYRRQPEDSGVESFSRSGSVRLPGLSRETPAQPRKSPRPSPEPSTENERSPSPSHGSSSRDKDSWGNKFSSASSLAFGGGVGAAMPLSTSQKLEARPPEANFSPEHRDHDDSTMALPRGRLSSERPSSPTKGLGGFVQSAMMKRSDSVNKRWSTQAAPGVKRADSIAASRGARGTARAPIPLTKAGGSPVGSKSHDSGPVSSPPPISGRSSGRSTSNSTPKGSVVDPSGVDDNAVDATVPNIKEVAEPSKLLTSSASLRSNPSDQNSRRDPSPEDSLPVSPTKTMDPRRWSPTKASWLESALSKPDSPKITSPRLEQPPWMADLQRSKQSKPDTEPLKGPHQASNIISPVQSLHSSPPVEHVEPSSIGKAWGRTEGLGLSLVPKAESKETTLSTTKDSKSPSPESVGRLSEPVLSDSSRISGATQLDAHSKLQQNIPENTPTLTASTSPLDLSRGLVRKKDPPALKPKPSTPPKTDFRANLKPRQKGPGEAPSAELEFKAMFGKLKSTETKNLVASDGMKANVLKGKAGLNLTGSPQKPQRVDDFKDSISKQKDTVTAGRGPVDKTSGNRTSVPLIPPKPSLTPEALGGRDLLRSNSSSGKDGANTVPGSGQPLWKKSKPAKQEPQTVPPDTLSDVHMSTTTANTAIPSIRPTHKPVVPVPDNLPEDVPAGKEQDTSPVAAESPLPQKASVTKEATPTIERSFAQKSEAVANSKLVNRLNPALAGFLARGQGSTPASRNQSTEDLSSALDTASRSVTDVAKLSNEGQLTHMTKARAKGPKRRLPKADKDFLQSVEVPTRSSSRSPGLDRPAEQSSSEPRTTRALATIINKNEKVGLNHPRQEFGNPLSHKRSERNLPDNALASKTAGPESSEKQKPFVAAKSPELKRVFSPSQQLEGPEVAEISTESEKPRLEHSPVLGGISSKKSDAIENPKDVEVSTSVQGTTIFRPTPQPPPASSTKTAKPQPKPQPKPQLPKTPDSLQSTIQALPKPLNGLGLRLESVARAHGDVPKAEPTPPPEGRFPKPVNLKSTPVANASTSTEKTATGETRTRGVDHKTRADAATVFEGFFDETPKTRDKAEFNSLSLVSSSSNSFEKTKLIGMQIWEITGDGKTQALPAQQEHILFEDHMYLCVHSFNKVGGGKLTEVYLWYGDAVSDAAVEDVQLFGRKVARDHNTKLEVLRQGKESANFFQALGGIVITRRAKSSALYMLCGRRHLGHVAFDEVDMDLDCLCSGFPYIVSAKLGKLYLWKGTGCGADELGCARLIANDLGLTNEIEEVNEGEEPAGFFESFPGLGKAEVPRSSGHWALKAGQDRYACRLFRVELEQAKSLGGFWTRRGSSPAKALKTASIQEISPFTQNDLEATHVYFLDAYFELYVFVGWQAKSKSVEFVTAVSLADEYRMLATSVQDRPLIPSCYVVFDEPPRDFQTVFRKWKPAFATMNPNSTARQPFALHAAMVALEP